MHLNLDRANTSVDYSRSSDTAKQTATVTEKEESLSAWLNTSFLCLCITLPLIVEHTHLLSIKHSFPTPAADTHLRRIIRLAAGDLASLIRPVCGIESKLRVLGWCHCTDQTVLLSVLVKNSLPTCSVVLPHHCHHSHFLSSRLLSRPLSSPVTASFLIALSLAAAFPHRYTCIHTPQSHLTVVNYNWHVGLLTLAG